MGNQQITKKQHYIPRMILKQHAARPPVQNGLIYQYDKKKRIERLPKISDVCYKDNLYELKDDSGRIVKGTENVIEKLFGVFEHRWNCIIDNELKNRAELSKEDLYLLYFLVAVQILRTPKIMKVLSDYLKSVSPQLSNEKADGYVKIASFLSGKFDPEKNWMLSAVLEHLFQKNLATLFSKDGCFMLSGDCPVLFLKQFDFQNYGDQEYFFPIASNICLGILNNAQENFYISAPENFAHFINREAFNGSDRFVYASRSVKGYIKQHPFELK